MPSDNASEQAVSTAIVTTNDHADWPKYWKSRGQPWRTEPEIGQERQHFLSERRNQQPSVKEGMYPFKDIKLQRADLEWLLATHESGGYVGPIDWSDEQQRQREGLDLRGADLSDDNLEFDELPLARVRFGLSKEERPISDPSGSPDEHEIQAAARLHPVSGSRISRIGLGDCHLQGAAICGVDLTDAYLFGADLEQAELDGAWLENAYMRRANLRHASLAWAHLCRANLSYCHLERANLRRADLRRVFIRQINAEGADFSEARIEKAYFADSDIQMATFTKADLRKAYFGYARLEGADFSNADLRSADFSYTILADAWFLDAHLEGARFFEAHVEGKQLKEEELQRISTEITFKVSNVLPGARLMRTYLDSTTALTGIVMSGKQVDSVRIVDVH